MATRSVQVLAGRLSLGAQKTLQKSLGRANLGLGHGVLLTMVGRTFILGQTMAFLLSVK